MVWAETISAATKCFHPISKTCKKWTLTLSSLSGNVLVHEMMQEGYSMERDRVALYPYVTCKYSNQLTWEQWQWAFLIRTAITSFICIHVRNLSFVQFVKTVLLFLKTDSYYNRELIEGSCCNSYRFLFLFYTVSPRQTWLCIVYKGDYVFEINMIIMIYFFNSFFPDINKTWNKQKETYKRNMLACFS